MPRTDPDADWLDLVPRVRETVREAASLALPFFQPGAQTRARVWSKSGGSPVTEADVAVDTFLKVRLTEIEPRAAWLSEETCDHPARLASDLVWVVDPIDGTRAFLSGHPDWALAVALLRAGEPVLGMVYAPAHGDFWEAAFGQGAQRNGQEISVSAHATLADAGISGPKSMVDRLAGRSGATVRRLDRVPSLALRIVRVADGSIDLGLISQDARDWDLAAADLILREAGGAVRRLDGRSPLYNRPEPRHGELIAASQALCDPVLDVLS